MGCKKSCKSVRTPHLFHIGLKEHAFVKEQNGKRQEKRQKSQWQQNRRGKWRGNELRRSTTTCQYHSKTNGFEETSQKVVQMYQKGNEAQNSCSKWSERRPVKNS